MYRVRAILSLSNFFLSPTTVHFDDSVLITCISISIAGLYCRATGNKMSKLAPISQKKRKLEEGIQGRTSRPKKRIRKQQDYHSSEDDESGNEGGFAPVNLDDSDDENKAPPATGANSTERNPAKKQQQPKSKSKSQADTDDDEASSDDASASASADSDINIADKPSKPKTKRNDPSAFTTSITRILSTTLPASTRSDPILSRSTTYHTTTTALKNEKLSARAAAHLRKKKREEFDQQRDKDVTGVQSGRAGEVQEEERRLRKIAQRGVVRLFNAVKAAQGGVDAKGDGGVGRKEREEKGREMSKRGFLELIGVKGVKTGTDVEEDGR